DWGEPSPIVQYNEAQKLPFLKACYQHLGLHRIPQIFGEDRNSFTPNRWLQTETSYAKSFPIHWKYGYNECPRGNLAQFERLQLMATLMRDYDIEKIDVRKE
ncbi:hypothetical protein N7537_002074, partial [Penicillium hordei]